MNAFLFVLIKTCRNAGRSDSVREVYRCLNCLDKATVFYGPSQLTLQPTRHSNANRLPELRVKCYFLRVSGVVMFGLGRVALDFTEMSFGVH